MSLLFLKNLRPINLLFWVLCARSNSSTVSASTSLLVFPFKGPESQFLYSQLGRVVIKKHTYLTPITHATYPWNYAQPPGRKSAFKMPKTVYPKRWNNHTETSTPEKRPEALKKFPPFYSDKENTVKPRLSGLFDYPNFSLWSQL